MFPNRNILGSESHLEYFADPFLTFHVRIKISHQKEPAKQNRGKNKQNYNVEFLIEVVTASLFMW